jgi:predicted TIM-barrel fold metal-dependent hydrolase
MHSRASDEIGALPAKRGLGMVIDAHVHLSEHRDDTLTDFARKNGLRYTLEELLDTMRRAGIERGLLLSPPLQGGLPLSNNEVFALCNKSAGMLEPVVTAEPSRKHVGEALRLAREHEKEVKAFKIRLGYVKGTAENPVFGKVYDYAESKGLPVLFHTGDTAAKNGDLARAHPLALDKLANKREKLSIVLCHFGNPWFEEAAELIYKHENVYADTSRLITGGRAYAEKYEGWLVKKISEAIYFVGDAEKILFGTDYPVTKHSDALDLVRRLEVDESDKEKILWQNAKRLFNL